MATGFDYLTAEQKQLKDSKLFGTPILEQKPNSRLKKPTFNTSQPMDALANDKLDFIIDQMIKMSEQIEILFREVDTKVRKTGLDGLSTKLDQIKKITSATLTPAQKQAVKNTNKQQQRTKKPTPYKTPPHLAGQTLNAQSDVYGKLYQQALSDSQKWVEADGKKALVQIHRRITRHSQTLVKIHQRNLTENLTDEVSDKRARSERFIEQKLIPAAQKTIADQRAALPDLFVETKRKTKPDIMRMKKPGAFEHKPVFSTTTPDGTWVVNHVTILGGDNTIHLHHSAGKVSYGYSAPGKTLRFFNAAGNNFALQTLAAFFERTNRMHILNGIPILVTALARFHSPSANKGAKAIFPQ